MDFARQQRNPGRHLVGIGGVVLLHVLIVYALVTGLARKVVEVVKGPIEVKVIEEVIKKPPPPPEIVPPPPKLAAPPPPFTPPPEVNIAPPPAPPPTITAVTPEPPPAPQAPVIAPPPPVVAPPAPPPPAVQSAVVVCPNYVEVMKSSIRYPREALLDGREGERVLLQPVQANGRFVGQRRRCHVERCLAPLLRAVAHRVEQMRLAGARCAAQQDAAAAGVEEFGQCVHDRPVGAAHIRFEAVRTPPFQRQQVLPRRGHSGVAGRRRGRLRYRGPVGRRTGSWRIGSCVTRILGSGVFIGKQGTAAVTLVRVPDEHVQRRSHRQRQ